MKGPRPKVLKKGDVAVHLFWDNKPPERSYLNAWRRRVEKAGKEGRTMLIVTTSDPGWGEAPPAGKEFFESAKRRLGERAIMVPFGLPHHTYDQAVDYFRSRLMEEVGKRGLRVHENADFEAWGQHAGDRECVAARSRDVEEAFGLRKRIRQSRGLSVKARAENVEHLVKEAGLGMDARRHWKDFGSWADLMASGRISESAFLSLGRGAEGDPERFKNLLGRYLKLKGPARLEMLRKLKEG